MKITPSQVHYLSPRNQEEMKKPCAWWKNGVPYVLGCLVLKGLSEAVVKYPTDYVAGIASQGLGYSIPICVLLGSYKLWKGLEAENNYLEAKKVEYVRIPRKDFDSLQSEIIRLRQEVEAIKSKDLRGQSNTGSSSLALQKL